jgi:hypothetical protein
MFIILLATLTPASATALLLRITSDLFKLAMKG